MKVLLGTLLLLFSIKSFAETKNVQSVDELINQSNSNVGKNQKELLATEVLILQSEDQALSKLKALILKYKGTSLEPELKFRLAELYMNQAKSARFIEQISSEVEEGQARSFLPSQIKSLREKKMVESAIQEYTEIETNFPKYKNLDQVLFNKAFAYLQIEQSKAAEQTFIKLLKTQRGSSLRPDAFLAVGEINFQARDFKRALAFYTKVKDFPDSRVYPYALYKGSWCYYNLRAYEQAIVGLEGVVEFGSLVEKEGKDQRLDLRVEALRDMALFYSATRSAKEAVGYFVKLAGNKDPIPGLRRLTQIYESHGKDVNQSIVLIGLIKKFPNSEKRPFFHRDLAKNLDRQGKYKYAAANLKAFYQICQREMKKTDGKEIEEPCLEGVRDVSRRLSLKWLKQYGESKKKDTTLALVSELGLRVHLVGQKPSDENSKMRFIFAEHLYELSKLLEASKEYTQVADSTKDEDRKHKSRYAAIVSYDKHYDSKFSKGKIEDQFRILSQAYMQNFPKGEHYLDVGFKLGLHDYTNKNYKLAAPMFVELGNNFFKEEKGKKSQDLYLDILNVKKDYVEIQKFALKWKKTEAEKERQTSLQSIFEQAFFSEVALLEKKKEYQKAINRYIAFIKEHPSSKLVNEARWNKIDLHFKLNEYDKTAEGYIAYQELHPDSKKALPGLIKAAEIYEMMAEPEKAFKVTQTLEKVDTKNKQKWGFLSANYLKASARYEDAAKAFLQIYKSPGGKELKQAAKEEFFSLSTQLMKDSPWYRNEMHSLISSPSREVASLAVRNVAIHEYKSGQLGDLNKTIDKFKNKGNLDKELIAVLNKYDGEKKEKEFFSFNINNQNMDTLVQGIQKKTAKLDQVQSAYQKALADENPKVAINALLGLSRTYQGFVSEIKELKPPENFSPEEAEALQAELNNIIIPFEEKAAEALDQAIKVAKEGQVKDGSLQKVKELFDVINFSQKEIFPVAVKLPDPNGPRGFK